MNRFIAQAAVAAGLLCAALFPSRAQDARQNGPGQFDFYVPCRCRGRRRSARLLPSVTMVNRPGMQCGARPYSFVVHGLWPQSRKGLSEKIAYSRRRGSITASSRRCTRSDAGAASDLQRVGQARHLLGAFRPAPIYATVRKARAAVKIPPEYVDLQQPLSVAPGRCARRIHQGQYRAHSQPPSRSIATGSG